MLPAISSPRNAKKAVSVGLLGNAAAILPEMVKRGVTPDMLTDQTSAHDELNGYVPAGIPMEDAWKLRFSDPDKSIEMAMASMGTH